MIPQDEFTAEHLSARLEELFAHSEMLAAAAAASREAGFDRAAARLADLVLEVMGAEPPDAVIANGRLAA